MQIPVVAWCGFSLKGSNVRWCACSIEEKALDSRTATLEQSQWHFLQLSNYRILTYRVLRHSMAPGILVPHSFLLSITHYVWLNRGIHGIFEKLDHHTKLLPPCMVKSLLYFSCAFHNGMLKQDPHYGLESGL